MRFRRRGGSRRRFGRRKGRSRGRVRIGYRM